MNVVLGTCTTNSRLSSSGRPCPSPQRPPRSGSTSPRRDSRTMARMNYRDSKVSKSTECSPRQLSPSCDCHPCQKGIGFLGVSEPKSYQATPNPHQIPCCKKKNSQHQTTLSVGGSNISRSPSAPNLYTTATSILAFQGSLTAFTAIVAGKQQIEQEKRDTGRKTPSVQQRQLATNIKNTHHQQNTTNTDTPTITIHEQPTCSHRQNTLSPTPRLLLHTHIPENIETMPNLEAWQERRLNTNDTKNQQNIKSNQSNRNSLRKETSV